jgi:hypothetical protein
MLRAAEFVPRSTLPLSAACVVANGVRETLSRTLLCELDVRLMEPSIPAPAVRAVLLAGAVVLRVRGRLADAFVLVRPADARRLVALAFGEADRRDDAALSAIERVTLERVLLGLVPLCNSLCGTVGAITRELPERVEAELVTYFEARVVGREPLAIGFGLTRDPAEDVCDCIALEALADVELRGRVEAGAGLVAARDFARLTAGSTLALDAVREGCGVLRFGDVAFARGTCGVSSGRAALRIETAAKASAAA